MRIYVHICDSLSVSVFYMLFYTNFVLCHVMLCNSLLTIFIALLFHRESQESDRKRTCYVCGLPRTEDENKIAEISELLMELFEPYVPVDIQMLPGRGQAYIKVSV